MIEILYEDDLLLICKKPSGTLSEDSEDISSLPRIIKKEYSEKGIELSLYPVHRLDREVCGAILYAKDQSTAGKLSAMISERNLKKEYIAVVEGYLEKKEDRLIDLLFKDSKRNKSFVVDRQRRGVKEAILDYSVIEQRENTSLVKIELHTGRTHQIRVQFSSRGHAVLGDRKYGSKTKANEISLCSHKLEFKHPATGKMLSVSCCPSINGLWEKYADILHD